MTHGTTLHTQRVDLRANLKRSWIDGVCYMLMVGLGEQLLPAFVLALGLGQVSSGWIATVPMLGGAILQLATPRLVARCDSHRRWVVAAAAVQALVFAPLAFVAWRESASRAAVFALATAYWASGLATGPAWITWMHHLVPHRVRARYFALRNRALWFAFVLCFVAAGAWLGWANDRASELQGFAVLFVCAGVARALSARYLALQDEPRPMPPKFRVVGVVELCSRFFGHGHGTLMLALFGVQIAVQVAAPFFTAFMREKLELSYASYACLFAAPYAARVVVLPWLGEFAHRRGARATLFVGGLLLVPTCLPWIATTSFGWLLAAQALLGAGLAAYELGTFLCFFESVEDSELTSVYAFYNLGNAACFALGSLIGGLLLNGLDARVSAYSVVFGLSTVLRLAVVPLLYSLARMNADSSGLRRTGA